jgi:hypothetical protein
MGLKFCANGIMYMVSILSAKHFSDLLIWLLAEKSYKKLPDELD